MLAAGVLQGISAFVVFPTFQPLMAVSALFFLLSATAFFSSPKKSELSTAAQNWLACEACLMKSLDGQ